MNDQKQEPPMTGEPLGAPRDWIDREAKSVKPRTPPQPVAWMICDARGTRIRVHLSQLDAERGLLWFNARPAEPPNHLFRIVPLYEAAP